MHACMHAAGPCMGKSQACRRTIIRNFFPAVFPGDRFILLAQQCPTLYYHTMSQKYEPIPTIIILHKSGRSTRTTSLCYDASLTQGSFTAVKIHCNVTMNLLSLRLRHPLLYFTHPPSLYNNIYLRLQSTEDTAQGLCLCVYCH